MTPTPRCRFCKQPLPEWTKTIYTPVHTLNEVASTIEGKPVYDLHTVEHEEHEGWGMAGDGLFCSVEHGYGYACQVIARRAKSSSKTKKKLAKGR